MQFEVGTTQRRWRLALVGALAAVFGLTLVRTAWVSDDAYLSFRSAWNLAEGYGPRWNVDERVQSFTNPLWVLLLALSCRLTGELYLTSLFLSMGLSLAAFVLVLSRCRTSAALVACGLALTLSKAFVEYSTSGLENPLTHFLLALFLLAFWNRERVERPGRQLLWLSLLAALLAVNRMDTVLLTAPALGWMLVQQRSLAACRCLLLGLTPLFAWILFAWFYYGFPFPNTAYAKAFGLGVPRAQILEQGLVYLQRSLEDDYVTLSAVTVCIVAALLLRQRHAVVLALSAMVYLAYVVWIGGGFMSGRFLAAPLLIAVVAVAWREPASARAPREAGASAPRSRSAASSARWTAALPSLALLALGMLSRTPVVAASSGFGQASTDPDWVMDNHASFYTKTGLLSDERFPLDMLGRAPADHGVRALVLMPAAGIAGFSGGPGLHVVDVFGLCDPLVARLPSMKLERFRPGHAPRALPEGFLQALWTGEDRIAHASLAEYYRKLRFVTRGPLWSGERLRAIVSFALGREQHLLREYLESDAALNGAATGEPDRLVRVALEDVDDTHTDGTNWSARGVLAFTSGRVLVELDGALHAGTVEVGLDANDDYFVLFGDDLGGIGTPLSLPANSRLDGGLVTHELQVPREAVERGYTWICVGGLTSMDGIFALGHVRLLDDGGSSERTR